MGHVTGNQNVINYVSLPNKQDGLFKNALKRVIAISVNETVILWYPNGLIKNAGKITVLVSFQI